MAGTRSSQRKQLPVEADEEEEENIWQEEEAAPREPSPKRSKRVSSRRAASTVEDEPIETPTTRDTQERPSKRSRKKAPARQKRGQPEPVVDMSDDDGGDADKEEEDEPEDGDGEHSLEDLMKIYRANAADTVNEAIARAVTAQEAEKLVAQVMRHMLFRQHAEPGVPVRREELVKIVSATYKHKRLPGYVIVRAQAKFVDIFGYEMKELERHPAHGPPPPAAATRDPSASRAYVLRSLLPATLRTRHVDNPQRRPEQLRALGLIVIALLKASQDRLEEKQLWEHLGRLGVWKGEEDHPAFGDVGQAFAELEKQRYVRSWRGEALPDGGHETLYTLAENGQSLVPQKSLQKHFKGVAASIG